MAASILGEGFGLGQHDVRWARAICLAVIAGSFAGDYLWTKLTEIA
jgi:hypothetical protein